MGKKTRKAKTKSSRREEEEVALQPKEGWLVELKEAEQEARDTAAANLRIAVAACRLRKFKAAKAASTVGLTMQPDETQKKKLLSCQKEATKGLAAIEDGKNRCSFASKLFAAVLEDGQNVDLTCCQHPTFNNVNVLQWAAAYGNVYVLEQAVAHGAALDFPVLQETDETNQDAFPAPFGTTALVLICASLAAYGTIGDAPGLLTAELKKSIEGMEECAIVLVNLGADTGKTLPKSGRRNVMSPFDPALLWNNFNLYGKTARELASMSKKPRLIKAMKELETRDDMIAKVHCRCGSRLPWLQCHAGHELGRSPIYTELSRGGLAFRYSPLAPCPCKLTKKKYWRCCWTETAKPTYQKDDTGELVSNSKMTINDPLSQLAFSRLAQRKQEIIDSGGDLNQPMFPELANMSLAESATKAADMIRSSPKLWKYTVCSNPQSKMGTWDHMVFAGCVERLDNYFMWNDLHWQLDKPELLTRVKEWNDALEQYCNDSGLTGAERQAVIEKHTASPCAPCGNPSCQAVETKAKEFFRCSRCKTIAYCKSECQKSHWKNHKKECLPNS